MRDYGKVAPQFWTGETGKRIRAAGPEAIIVAVYLMTSPHANMIGLYYLPMLYLAHETGLGLEGALKGLIRVCDTDFCTYDEASEHVFVHAMARFQIAASLKPEDLRCKGVRNDLEKCPKGLLVNKFVGIYGDAFHLKMAIVNKAPSKPLASQEQEQEQEQEQIDCLEQAAKPIPVCLLPLNTGPDFQVTEDHVAEFKQAYPAVDVMQQLKAMRAWIIANPVKRKTKSGILRFVNSWLAKEQDSPSRSRQSHAEPASGNSVAASRPMT